MSNVVIDVPANPETLEDTPLVFSTANGNAITLSDPDSNVLTVYVAADGILHLGSTAGLTFLDGGDGSYGMEFSGTIADINAALDGLTYTPDPDIWGSGEIDITANDGSGPYTVQLFPTIDPVNDAPILTPFTPALTAVQADNHNPAGQKIAAVFGPHIDDSADAFGLPYGIAITSITATGGRWQYSINNGGSWTNFPTGIDESAALVLRAADYIRFLPDGTTSGVETFTYRAWDESDGSTTGTQVDITATGGETAFSTASDTAHLNVNTTPRLQSVIATDASPTNASVVHYTVTFTVPVTGVDASQFLLTSTGGVTGAGIASVTGSGTTYTVAVNTGTGDGRLVLDVKGSGIHDLAGNAYTGGMFLAPATVTAGDHAWGVAIGDLNGDGKADVVTADEGDATLAVMLGNGDGTLHTRTFVGAVGPLAVAIGDVDGDGKMDLIATNWFANSISVLRGNGDGTFKAKQDTATGTGTEPVALATGDFNGDNKLDVVTANEAKNNLTILLGNGDGTFAAASGSPIGAGNAPAGVAVADLNNDGKQDIVAINAAGIATVLLGNGNGTFALKSSPFVGANTQAVALADLNGDGKIDMVAADNLNNTANVLLGKGDGTFQNPVDYAAGSHPYSVAIGDVNGDGKPDLVLADDNTAGTVAVLLGNGNGTFQSALTATVGNTPRDAVLGDLNGDGFLDVVATNENDNTVSVLLNGSASYTITDAAPSNTAPASADVNENASVVFDTAHGNAITVADTDNTTQTVTLHVSHGALSLAQTMGLSFTAGDGAGDATMTFSGAITDINAALDGLTYTPGANYNGADSITVLSDDGRKQHSSATSVTIAPANSAPTGTDAHVSTQEDHGYTFAAGDFGFSDPNDGPTNALLAVEITTLPAAGTLTDNGVAVTAGQFVPVADIVAGHLVYTPAADGNGVGYASFTFQVQDDGGTANGGIDTDPAPKTITVDVTAVDDAPTGLPASNIVAYAEDDGASALFGSLSIADADNPANLAGGSIAVSLSDPRTGDVLSFVDGGPFSVSGTDVLFNATVVGSVTSGTVGATAFTVTLNSAATLGVVEQLLENLGYASTSNDPTFGGSDDSRSVAVTLDDGGNTGTGSGTTSSTVQVAITASNDAPVAVAPGVHYAATEQTALDLKGTGLSVSDVDGGTETLVIAVGEGTLTATQGDSGTSVSGSGTNTLTISGTVDAINTFLNSGTSTLTYIDNTDTPSASTMLSLSIDDSGHTGIGGAHTGTASATIDITAVNDAPVLGSGVSSVGYTEGSAPVTLAPAITITDADSVTLAGAAISLSGFIAGDELRIDGNTSGDIVNGGNTIHYSYDSATGTLSLSGSDTVADYQAALRLVTYDSTSLNPTNIGGAPAPTRNVGWTVDDGAAANNHNAPIDTAIAITAVDSPPVARADHFATDIATAIGSGLSLFDDNGSGADSDPDGSAITIAAVAGGTVGTPFTLGSGALLTVNSDGTFSYDPGHAFDNLHLASPASGAANSSTTDGFQYTLAGGSTATVTVTVNGTDDASTVYVGDVSHADISGGPGGHLFDLTAAADYAVTGGSGNDGFKFGDTFDGNDHVDGGGGTNNQMQVGGIYGGVITLDPSKVTNIQVMAFAPGETYSVQTLAGFVGDHNTFTFWSVSMDAGSHVTIDGSAETDGGAFTFYLGQGGDTATGGTGNDLFYGEGGADHLTGGAGADTFAYLAPSDSNAAAYDSLDFRAGTDKILLNGTSVSVVDAAFSASLSVAGLDGDLATLLGNGAVHELDAGHAVVITGDSGGDLNGHTFLVIGTSGAASGYAAGADYVFDISAGAAASLAPTDFM